MLKNRLNQLRQYFPGDYGEQQRTRSSHERQLGEDGHETKLKLEEMDFFNLLKHTGFIKEAL